MLLRKERTEQEFETGAIGSKKGNTTYDFSGNMGLSSSNNNSNNNNNIIINNNYDILNYNFACCFVRM